jgi:F-box interacting protein
VISDCCCGLILCWCIRFRNVVCNPVTNKWWLLSDNNRSFGSARSGFDPIVPSHFHVIEYRKKRAGEPIGVSIYSSKSVAWMFKKSKWGEGVVRTYSTSMFLNGFIHWLELS